MRLFPPPTNPVLTILETHTQLLKVVCVCVCIFLFFISFFLLLRLTVGLFRRCRTDATTCPVGNGCSSRGSILRSARVPRPSSPSDDDVRMRASNVPPPPSLRSTLFSFIQFRRKFAHFFPPFLFLAAVATL